MKRILHSLLIIPQTDLGDFCQKFRAKQAAQCKSKLLSPHEETFVTEKYAVIPLAAQLACSRATALAMQGVT
jgi:hypothetical protein